MSKTKNRNSLLSSHNRTSVANSVKDELLTTKFVMNKPTIPLYPLNEVDNTSEYSSGLSKYIFNDTVDELTYPDFKPWKDTTHLPEEKSEIEVKKLNNEAYLNKGYFEGPLVANEYYSARNLVQASLFSSSDNCDKVLKELSKHLVNSYRTRNEEINKIKCSSNNFKIPPRVTLTALKKEAWLRDLANPDEPLLKISSKLPHGIKNKVLVDILCSKSIPLSRALWLTKCVLYSELLALRKKYQSRTSTNNLHSTGASFETQWLQEWTHQLADYFYKFSKDMSSISSQEKKHSYLTKLNYLLNYVQSLYIECLVDKTFFINSILKFLREGLPLEQSHISELLAFSRSEGEESLLDKWLLDIDLNFGQRLVSLTLVKMFWKDILELDYLSKELSELLLLNYYFIERIPTYSMKPSGNTHKQNHTAALSLNLKAKLLNSISDTVTYLFKYNTNVFIIPNYWSLVNDVLYKILLGEFTTSDNSEEQTEIRKQLTLIKYRNESLMLNMKHVQPSTNSSSITSNNSMIERRGSVNLQPSQLHDSNDIDTKFSGESCKTFEGDNNFINRSNEDVLNIIDQLDRLKLNDSLAELLMPKSVSLSAEDCNDWKINLKLVVYWAITIYREQVSSSENILIVCNFLKRKVLQSLDVKNANNLRAEFENEILEIIYNLAHSSDIKVVDYNVYVLINELYQLKVITISSYLRKLIASGIFYLSPGEDGSLAYIEDNSTIQTHLAILQNLPVLNNKQCDSILKKWTPSGFNFEKKFDKGKQILKNELINRLMSNSFDEYCEEDMTYIKGLKVGLKFLLVNWFTSELKLSISNSPKLIHINPNSITSLYHFYSICDNLTVFFKVMIKFILRNEGKIIICYMDSLYLISKLIIRHFKLVKFIAGNSYDSPTTGYELFKLIILNYKDLLTRDNDYYNFSDIWYFIDNVVEKNDSTYEKSSESNPKITSKSKSFNQLLFAKESIDSPMKIHANSTIPHKNNEVYTSTDFRNDLDSLLEAPIQLLSNSDVADFISTLQIEVNIEVFNETSSIEQFINTITNFFYDKNGSFTELQENLCMRLLINAQKCLNITSKNNFFVFMRNCVVNLMKRNLDIRKLIIFFKKLLCFEIYQLHELLPLIKCLSLEQLSSESVDIIVYELIFGNLELEGKDLFNDQLLALNIIRHLYIKLHSSEVFIALLKSISKEEQPLLDCLVLTAFKSRILTFLRQFVIFNTKFFIDGLLKSISKPNIFWLLNSMIFISSSLIENSSDISRLAPLINEFNLPICQVLIKVIIINELDDSADADVIQKQRIMLDLLLNNLRFYFVACNSYFGELFNYVSWDLRLNILSILEDEFLCKTKFNIGDDNFMNDRVNLMSVNGNNNLLPILKDYFKKFSVSSFYTVSTSNKVFYDLSKFLQKLLLLANSDIKFSEEDKLEIYNTISIFVRILIIHKFSLTSIILERDGQNFHFIRNLISLLESKFLSFNNEKLRILLYDLLLLMKSSITLSVTLKQENSLADDISSDVASSNQHNLTPVDENSTKRNPENLDISNSYSKYFGLLHVSQSMNLSSIFTISEPNISYPLKKYSDDTRIQCARMLENSELHKGGDIHTINESKLILLPSRRETLRKAFDILNGVENDVTKTKFNLKSYKLLEDCGAELNSGCINLLFFDSFTTKENPP